MRFRAGDAEGEKPFSIIFGFPKEWERFANKHPAFLREFKQLNKTFGRVFGRVAETRSVRDRIIFFMGSLCFEEFKEILLLCGNGYGIGAAKLLRGFYEKAVTCAYLAKDPVAFTDFINFHHIQKYRELNHLKSVKGTQLRMSADEEKEIREKYDRVKRHFEEVLCRKCDIRRPQPSWTKLSLPAMAHKVGREYERLYFSCFFQPTMQSHATVQSFGVRLTPRKDGGTDFSGAAQRKLSSRVMGFAHVLSLLVISSQNDYFNLGLSQRVAEHAKQWGVIWKHSIYPAKGSRLTL